MAERPTSNLGNWGLDISLDEAALLRCVLEMGPLSRAEITKAIPFSRSKATDLVAELLSKNILVEIDRPGGDYSKWKNLAINQKYGYLIGIDIGTTSVDVALADCGCQLIAHQSVESNVNDGPEIVLGQAEGLLETILKTHGVGKDEILGVGVGVPGPVRYPLGEVIGGQFTPGWEGFKIQDILLKFYPDAVIAADNDANLMALGAYKAGLAQKTENFIFVKVGTGIGAGVFCYGKLYRGATSCAGHIGHTCVDFNGPVCRCGNRGCLEALAGGLGIAEAAEKAASDGKSDILVRLQEENQGRLTPIQVGQAAALRDPVAQEIIIRSATLIGSVLAGVVNLFNPELIVLGGGVSKLGDLFLAEIRRETLKRTYSYTTMGLRIELCPMFDPIGVVGATHFIRDWVFSVEGQPLSSMT